MQERCLVCKLCPSLYFAVWRYYQQHGIKGESPRNARSEAYSAALNSCCCVSVLDCLAGMSKALHSIPSTARGKEEECGFPPAMPTFQQGERGRCKQTPRRLPEAVRFAADLREQWRAARLEAVSCRSCLVVCGSAKNSGGW